MGSAELLGTKMRLELPKRTKNRFQLRTRWKSKCRRHFRLIGDWGFFKRNLSSARHWHKSNKSIATTQSFFETGTDVSAHLLGHETLFFNHSDWESGLDSFFWWGGKKIQTRTRKKNQNETKNAGNDDRERFRSFYHNSPSLSLAGTSMTRGFSMIRAVRSPFSTMPMIQAWWPSCCSISWKRRVKKNI